MLIISMLINFNLKHFSLKIIYRINKNNSLKKILLILCKIIIYKIENKLWCKNRKVKKVIKIIKIKTLICLKKKIIMI